MSKIATLHPTGNDKKPYFRNMYTLQLYTRQGNLAWRVIWLGLTHCRL